MFIELSLQIIIPLLILLIFWAMPALTAPDLAFGVRIPPNHLEDSLISQVRRDFRIGIVLIALILVIARISLAAFFSSLLLSTSVFLSMGTLFVVLILASIDYYIAHYRLTAVKRREDWYAGQRQAIAVDTELIQEPVRMPIPLLVLTIALVVAMFVIGALRYPSLPARIPIHFDINGIPNNWVDKSFFGVFMIPIMALVLTMLFIALARFLPTPQAQIDPANVEVSRARYHKLRNVWGVSIILTSVLTNILMLLISLVIWQLIPAATQTSFIGITIAVVPALIILSVLAIYYRQLGGRTQGRQSQSNNAQPAYVARDDDRYWKGGMFYFNRDNPSIFVEKRFGIGWTINFGHPIGILFMVVMLVITVGSLSLALFVR